MIRDGRLVLTAPYGAIDDASTALVEMARDRRVLNVGAAGGIHSYLPGRRDIWLHEKLGASAAELVGVDIDRESIAFARQHDVELTYGNVEALDLPTPFDLIVLSDVIEHLHSPIAAMRSCARSLAPGGRVVITTPNMTHWSLFIKSVIRPRDLGIFHEHTAGFLPEHIGLLGSMCGLRVDRVDFFTNVDTRTASTRVKSALSRVIGGIAPRLSGWFLIALSAA